MTEAPNTYWCDECQEFVLMIAHDMHEYQHELTLQIAEFDFDLEIQDV